MQAGEPDMPQLIAVDRIHYIGIEFVVAMKMMFQLHTGGVKRQQTNVRGAKPQRIVFIQRHLVSKTHAKRRAGFGLIQQL